MAEEKNKHDEKNKDKGNAEGFDSVKKIHKQISEEMWLLNSTIQYLTNEDAYGNVRKVINFFKDTILRHFNWEEQNVFPIALAIGELEIKQIVRELQQQHIIAISKFDILADIISKYGFSFPNEEIKRKFITTSKELLEIVIPHARKEDAELFQFLEEKNVRLDFMEGGIL